MIIEYLELMDSTKRIFGEENEPVKENDIINFGQKINETFPKAYKEFLFLGGDGANMMGNVNYGFYNPYGEDKVYMELIQERVHNFLEKEKLEIEGGEYWVICELDGGEQFDFFYFNDPDAEEPETPLFMQVTQLT